MNRQLKRANEKSDKRREREQTKRKTQRQASRILRSAQVQSKPAPKRTSPTSGERRTTAVTRPWFVRLYLIFSLLIILSQAVVPQRTDVMSYVVYGFFFLTLGYSLCLWLYGRGNQRALVFTLVGGLALALLVEGLKFVIPGPTQLEQGFSLEPNLLLAAVAVPGLALGAWLGQTIHRRT